MNPNETLPGNPNGGGGPLGRIGRYEIVAELGSGQFGRVYRGYYRDLDRDVAIKVPVDANPTPELRDLFLQEARAAAKVKHQFVCEIYEVGEEGNRPYIVMPFIESGTLADELLRTPLPPIEVALTRTRDIALGLEAAHRKGLLHRDIKPANVLFDTENQRVLLTDFGLAKLIDATASRAIRGTPLYMSPEQWHPEGGQKPGPASDVYSLGCILYQMLTGVTPHQCPDGNVFALGFAVLNTPIRPPSAVNPRVGTQFDDLCMKALKRGAAERFTSAKAFADGLDAKLLSDRVGTQLRPTAPSPAQRAQAEADYKRGDDFYFGRGVPKDYAKAREWYEKAAAQNHAAAQADLGFLYENGHGVPKDYAKAREWYEKAAAQNHAPAQFNLGVLYRRGLGVTRDDAKAREWYEKAAAQNHAAAQANLGLLYHNGYGVPKDYAKAREWYEKAAAQNNANGQAYLAELLENGKGGPKDTARALELYRKAAKQGSQYAKDALKRLGQPE